jgi:hypothetical protein
MRVDRPKLGVLKSQDPNYKHYIDACNEIDVESVEIDFLSPSWIDAVRRSGCDGFLLRPPCEFQEQYQIYVDRARILHEFMGKPVYPSLNSMLLYENKRAMADFLEARDLPRAKTWVFQDRASASAFCENCSLPIVIKSSIGAAANGVEIVRERSELLKKVDRHFWTLHPKLSVGYAKKNGKKFWSIPDYRKAQRGFVILQEFHQVRWEWRIIHLNGAFFGHQKLLKGDFASGSDLVGWERPPDSLLDLTASICERDDFDSMAIDIFETMDGQFVINELQALFGSYNPSQMYLDGRPGKFIKSSGQWEFVEGCFNRHGSYLARVESFVKKLQAL